MDKEKKNKKKEPIVTDEGRSTGKSSVSFKFEIPREMIIATILDDINSNGPVRNAILKMLNK